MGSILKNKSSFAVALLLWSGLALAEQGCPAGLFPGGTQPGGAICVPIPGYGATSSAPAPSPPPRLRWEDRWGAIAADGPNAAVGTASGMADKVMAETAALSDCQRKGGVACQVDASYANQCAVLITGDKEYFVQLAPTIDEASRNGIQKCSISDVNCRAYYANCSFPELVP